MSNDLNLASLGTATGTTVDSPAKHIMACKMDTNYLITLLKFAGTQSTDAYTLLHDNKMRWCMHKHELALFTGKKLCPGSTFTGSNPKAYPLVITTVGDMHQYTKHFLANLYNQPTPYDFYHLCAVLSNQIGLGSWYSDEINARIVFGDDDITTQFIQKWREPQTKEEMNMVIRQIASTPDFRCQGVALGQAWASHISGDTVALSHGCALRKKIRTKGPLFKVINQKKNKLFMNSGTFRFRRRVLQASVLDACGGRARLSDAAARRRDGAAGKCKEWPAATQRPRL